MVVAGWFEGVTAEQLRCAAAELLTGGKGFSVQWWGLAEVSSRDRRQTVALEVGGRALRDAERENSGSAVDREAWIAGKALTAAPMAFATFVAVRCPR